MNHNRKEVQEVRRGKTEQARQLQAEAMLKALNGRVVTKQESDKLYENDFAVGEMGAGRLIVEPLPTGKDKIHYHPPASIKDLSSSQFPRPR